MPLAVPTSSQLTPPTPVDYDGPSQALFPGSALVIKCRSLRLLAQHSMKHKSGLTWLSILSILAESLTHRQSLVSKLQCCLGSLSLASFPGAFCDPKMSNKSSRRKCFIGFGSALGHREVLHCPTVSHREPESVLPAIGHLVFLPVRRTVAVSLRCVQGNRMLLKCKSHGAGSLLAACCYSCSLYCWSIFY